MGKTRRLLQLLRTHKGSFHVDKEAGGMSNNAGSWDLGLVACRLEEVALHGDLDESKLRIRADFGARCVLASRLGVLKRLEAQFGELTPAQWLLVQLHPELVAGYDFLGEVALRVFERCSLATVQAVRTPSTDYLIVVDEAHGLANVLKGMLESTGASSDASGRSFLSSVVTQSNQLAGSRTVLSGVDAVLADAIPRSSATASASDVDWSFRPFSSADVAAMLRRVAGVQAAPENLAKLLAGRPRFTTRFVERLVAQAGAVKPLLELGAAFVDNVTLDTGDKRIIVGGVVSKLREREHPNAGPRKVRVRFPPRLAGEIEVELTGQFQALRFAAFALCNGASARMHPRDAMALVKAEVMMVAGGIDSAITDVTLEPMVLVALLRGHYEDAFFVERLRTLQQSAPSMGFEFEWLVGHRLTRSWLPAKEPVPFNDLPLIKPHAKKLPAWCKSKSAKLVAFEPRLGRIAEPGADLHKWFHRHLALARSTEAGADWGVMGKFPGRYAGPDFAMLVKVSDGLVAVVALVLVQVKLVSKVTPTVLKEACASVDPALLYHINRVPTSTKKTKVIEARRASQEAFVEALKSVPVIRMVVAAGGESGKAEVQAVKHRRAGAQFKEDLLIVVAGKAAMEGLFGAQIGEAVLNLKSARDDDETGELAEGGYDHAEESREVVVG